MDAELNAKIARLMGFRKVRSKYQPSAPLWTWLPPNHDRDIWPEAQEGDRPYPVHSLVPNYSGDPAACAQLRQHVAKLPAVVQITLIWEKIGGCWSCIVEEGVDWVAQGPTEEEATARACAAALEALAGAKEER